MPRGTARNSKPKREPTAKALEKQTLRLLRQALGFLEEELNLLTESTGGARHGGDAWKEVLQLSKGICQIRKEINASTPVKKPADPRAAWLERLSPPLEGADDEGA